MGNLCIRAIETNEDIMKVINSEFTPGLVSCRGFDKRVKFEMKKMKKISRKYKRNDVIEIKLDNKFMDCKINNISVDEITGIVSWVELEKISKPNLAKKKIPIVFKNIENLKLGEKELKVFLTEVDIRGKNEDIPEYLIIDINDIETREFTISNLKLNKNLKVMNKKDDVIALIRSKSCKVLFPVG
jgi:hypothetical protein